MMYSEHSNWELKIKNIFLSHDWKNKVIYDTLDVCKVAKRKI